MKRKGANQSVPRIKPRGVKSGAQKEKGGRQKTRWKEHVSLKERAGGCGQATDYAYHEPVSSWPQPRRPMSMLCRPSLRRPQRAALRLRLPGTSSSGYEGVANEETRHPRNYHAHRAPPSRTSSSSGYQGLATEETRWNAWSPRPPRNDHTHRALASTRDTTATTKSRQHNGCDTSALMTGVVQSSRDIVVGHN